eukprot:m.16308 g.16308  ORF g.16308 m.16308 type:complete len:153 (-) comp10561_c0_seq17:307-765(-)
MLASHTTFVQEHRQRLEHHIDRFSQWLESSSTPTPTDMVGLKAQLDTMCKDQALAHAQLEKELQATIQQLKSRVTLLGQELASCREAHVALRQQCEVRGLDVGQGSKAELSDVDPSAEVDVGRKLSQSDNFDRSCLIDSTTSKVDLGTCSAA